jgi:hypothetical protein
LGIVSIVVSIIGLGIVFGIVVGIVLGIVLGIGFCYAGGSGLISFSDESGGIIGFC